MVIGSQEFPSGFLLAASSKGFLADSDTRCGRYAETWEVVGGGCM